MSDSKPKPKPAAKAALKWKEGAQVGMALGLFGVGIALAAAWSEEQQVHRVLVRDEDATEEELGASYVDLRMSGIVRVEGNPGGAFDYDVAINQRILALDFQLKPGTSPPDEDGDELYKEDLGSPTDGGNSPADDGRQRGGFHSCHVLTAYFPDGKETNTATYCSGVYWGQWNTDRLWRWRFLHDQHGFGVYDYRGTLTTGEVYHCGWGAACWKWHANDFHYAFNLVQTGA